VQHLQGRLTRVVVLIEPLPSDQRDHDLPQPVPGSAVNGVGTSAFRRPPRLFELISDEPRQRPRRHEDLRPLSTGTCPRAPLWSCTHSWSCCCSAHARSSSWTWATPGSAAAPAIAVLLAAAAVATTTGGALRLARPLGPVCAALRAA
jgi:hypothetical protein